MFTCTVSALKSFFSLILAFFRPLQRLSLTIQRFNAVCFNGSFCLKNADPDS